MDSQDNTTDELVKQSEDVEKQMVAEHENDGAAISQPEVDHTIMADPSEDAIKPLSEIASEQKDPDPTTLINMSSLHEQEPKTIKKHNHKFFILIGIILVAVAAIALAIWFIISQTNSDNGGAVATDAKAFFIENADGSGTFAAFNDQGKQLTDFEFSNHSDFYDGYAVVEKKDAGFAVLANTGKLAIPFGEYESIKHMGKYFYVENGDNASVITETGDEIIKANDFEEWESLYFIGTPDGTILFLKDGSRLGKVSSATAKPNIRNGFTVISMENGEQYIINTKTGSKVGSFNRDNRYDFKGSYFDDNIIIARPQTDEDDEKITIIYWNGKCYEWNEGIYGTPTVNDNYQIIESRKWDIKNSDRHVMLNNGKIIADDKSADADEVYYYSESSYAIEHMSNKNSISGARDIKIVTGDKNIEYKNIKWFSPSANYHYIVIDEDWKAHIIDQNGKELFTYTNKKMLRASDIDDNNLVTINNNLLVNIDGVTVYEAGSSDIISPLYKDKYLVEHGANSIREGSKAKTTVYIVDASGKTPLSDNAKYTNVDVLNGFYRFEKDSGGYDLYDGEMKLIISDFSDITVEEAYIIGQNDNNKKYFTYSGKQFYEN